MISRETDFTKQESSTSDTAQTFNSSSSTASWSRLKDPRIVRVSRALGGKDRHSKVCTVRGLRDRRVRLSVPTAIQLYDLQDRLGLNQPSKVVDWLLNVAKNEIDELPPLQFPQGCLLPMLNISHSDKQGLSGKSKDVSEEREENWGRTSDEGRDFNLGINQENAYVSAQQNQSSLVSSLMNPINSFVRWDPSNISLSQSQPPRSPGSSPHHHHQEDWHNFSLVYQPSGVIAQPYFHSQISASNDEFDAKNLNFQSSHLSSSSTLPARPVHFNMTANLLRSQNYDGS